MPNKKRPEPARLVETVEDIVDFEDGGIFWHEKVIGQKRGKITVDQRIAILRQMPDLAARLRAALASAESQAREIVSPYAKQYPEPVDPPPGHVMTGIDLGEGPRATVLPAELPDEAAEAVDVLRLARSVRWMIDRDPDAARVLATAYELGRVHERILVRPHEPDALDGKRGRTTRPAVARKNRWPDAAKHQAWVRKEYTETLTRNPKDKAGARRLVLEAFKHRFPAVKPPKDSTIKRWVGTPRRKSSRK